MMAFESSCCMSSRSVLNILLSCTFPGVASMSSGMMYVSVSVCSLSPFSILLFAYPFLASFIVIFVNVLSSPMIFIVCCVFLFFLGVVGRCVRSIGVVLSFESCDLLMWFVVTVSVGVCFLLMILFMSICVFYVYFLVCRFVSVSFESCSVGGFTYLLDNLLSFLFMIII